MKIRTSGKDSIGKAITEKIEDIQKTVQKEVDTKVAAKEKKLREYRKEASRLASMANKRIKRLEGAGLKDSPAYKKWLADGGEKFSVKGKDHNELQREVARMRQFINSQTSTIRGVNTVLKDMAKNTGIRYKNLTELREKAITFFELASKVEQYLRTVDDMASSIGYQKIWEAVNKYIQNERKDLASADVDIDKMVKEISKAMMEYDEKIDLDSVEGLSGWFTLPKD